MVVNNIFPLDYRNRGNVFLFLKDKGFQNIIGTQFILTKHLSENTIREYMKIGQEESVSKEYLNDERDIYNKVNNRRDNWIKHKAADDELTRIIKQLTTDTTNKYICQFISHPSLVYPIYKSPLGKKVPSSASASTPFYLTSLQTKQSQEPIKRFKDTERIEDN